MLLLLGANCVDMSIVVDASLYSAQNYRWVEFAILDMIERFVDPLTHYNRVQLLVAGSAWGLNIFK